MIRQRIYKRAFDSNRKVNVMTSWCKYEKTKRARNSRKERSLGWLGIL